MRTTFAQIKGGNKWAERISPHISFGACALRFYPDSQGTPDEALRK